MPMTPSGDARPQLHWNVGYWVVAVLLLLWLQSLWRTSRSVEPVPYSQFEQALAQGRITDVKIGDTTITGRLKEPVSNGKTTIVAVRVEPDLAGRLEKYGVPYTRGVESTFLRDLLSWVAPAAVFFGLCYFIIRWVVEKQGGGVGAS